MKKILAVSGGVDSVVMLHMFRDDEDAIVAHFDHGIRSNSAEDCAFVERLAKRYGKPFFSKRVSLGDCSEEKARDERYKFLRALAKEHGGEIYLAHHADDLVESVIINLLRGTGWRGLAPLSDLTLKRPLLKYRKKDLYKYAAEHNLTFRVDQSNYDEKYLRNRVRATLEAVDHEDFSTQIIELCRNQQQLSREISELESALAPALNQRAAYDETENLVALELLRFWLQSQSISQTRPQLERILDAIRNFQPQKRFSLGRGKFLRVGRYYLSVEQG